MKGTCEHAEQRCAWCLACCRCLRSGPECQRWRSRGWASASCAGVTKVQHFEGPPAGPRPAPGVCGQTSALLGPTCAAVALELLKQFHPVAFLPWLQHLCHADALLVVRMCSSVDTLQCLEQDGPCSAAGAAWRPMQSSVPRPQRPAGSGMAPAASPFNICAVATSEVYPASLLSKGKEFKAGSPGAD